MPKLKEPLSPRDRLFIHEYLADLKPTAAMLRCGYEGERANQAAHKVMNKPAVKAEIERRLASRAKKADVKADDVIKRYREIAMADVGGVIEWGPNGPQLKKGAEVKPEHLAALAAMVEVGKKRSVRVKLDPQLEALAALARHLNLFKFPLQLPSDDEPQGIVIGRFDDLIKRFRPKAKA